jgi:hypothetical protein
MNEAGKLLRFLRVCALSSGDTEMAAAFSKLDHLMSSGEEPPEDWDYEDVPEAAVPLQPPAPTVRRLPLRTARPGELLHFTNNSMGIAFQVEEEPVKLPGTSGIGKVNLSASDVLFTTWKYNVPPQRLVRTLRFEWDLQKGDFAASSMNRTRKEKNE